MDDLVRNAVGGSGLLGAVAILGLGRRHPAAGVVALVAAVVSAAALGWIPAALPSVDALSPACLLVASLVVGVVGRAADPWLPRSAGVAAMLGGLLIGDIATAVLLAPRCPDSRSAIRVALVASGAALASPIGTPATLLVGWSPDLVLLALPLALVAWPVGVELQGGGRLGVTALLGAVAVGCAAFPDQRLAILGVGALALGAATTRSSRPLQTPGVPWPAVTWLVGITVTALAADHSGALAEAATGLALVHDAVGDVLQPATLGAALLASAVAGESAGALLATGLLDTHAIPDVVSTRHVVIGLAAGGLGPALLARRGGPLRPLWTPWLAQLLVLAIWATLAG